MGGVAKQVLGQRLFSVNYRVGHSKYTVNIDKSALAEVSFLTHIINHGVSIPGKLPYGISM